jgi:iron complex transport system ATP-binding protein
MENKQAHSTLVAKDLSIGYRKKKEEKLIHENLQLELKKGELLCLMGPNGAGKSTLLRTLAGIQPPLAGKVWVAGKELHQLNATERARLISLVLTETISAGNMTVLELVALGRYPHTQWSGQLSAADKALVEQALEDAGIRELAGEKLYELSDGQRQKALIARALAQDGALIILDEPTAHLDLINRLQTMRLLRLLALRRQKAIVVATHELDLALQSADRLWLLGNKQAGLTAGVPEDLVLNGKLADTFSRSGFYFDAHSGEFREEQQTCLPIQLKGEGPAYFWTRKALQRLGYEAVSESSEFSVKILQEKKEICWKLQAANRELYAYSIEELIRHLVSQTTS